MPRPILNIYSLLLLLIIIDDSLSKTNIRTKRGLSYSDIRLWPNKTIPFFVDERIPVSGFYYLKKAIQTFSAETCLQFVDYNKSQHKNWLTIKRSRSCYSEVGVLGGGQQNILLSKYCLNYGLILHELSHTIGLVHEMMRPDRDEYIQLNEENIQDHVRDGFTIETKHNNHLDTPFDFQSITMYSAYEFSKNGLPVWTALNDTDENIEVFDVREKDLSFWDVKAINKLYRCSENCSNNINCTYPSFINKFCECQSIKDFAIRRCKDNEKFDEICSNASLTNFCYDNPTEASFKCRNTCGRCFRYEEYGLTTPPPYVCMDNYKGDCENRKKDGMCYIDNWTQINCRRTCDRCHFINFTLNDNEDKAECRDRYMPKELCASWAKIGNCKLNPSFMLGQCARSCGSCAVNNSKSTIYNEDLPCKNYSPDSYCDTIALQNKCFGTTLKVCLGSCGKCGTNYERQDFMEHEVTPHPKIFKEETDECKDLVDNCKIFAEKNACKTHFKSMKHHCAKTCNFCGTGICFDEESHQLCDAVKQRGYCTTKNNYSHRCQKSCGLCKRKKTEKVNSLKTCVDIESKSYCKNLFEQNQCQSKSKLAIKCRFTCGQCRNISQSNCVDKLESQTCEAYAQSRYCHQNKQYMRQNCAKSCGFCQSKSREHKNCKDKEDSLACQYWANSGFCQKNEKYMRRNCEKSCNFCTKSLSDAVSNRKSNACKDKENDESCKSWKSSGYCTSPHIAQLCLLTCSKC